MNPFVILMKVQSTLAEGDNKDDLELTIRTFKKDYKNRKAGFPSTYYFYKDKDEPYYNALHKSPKPKHNQTVYKYYNERNIYRVMWATDGDGNSKSIDKVGPIIKISY